MSITSPVWLAVMFGSIAVYWLLALPWRQHFLVAATVAFLAVADPRSLVLVGSFVVLTHWLLLLRHRAAVVAALSIPLAALAYYKVQGNAAPLATMEGVAIPLGLSYTVFRVLHYVIERSRDNLPSHRFSDYLAYIFFLPTILIGPINRFPQFLHDRREGGWRAEQISGGLERILIGYFKVTVIGNTLLSGVASEWALAASGRSVALGHYLEAVVGSLNLYFQFSGFSDVAIGFALMLGHRVLENFHFPFLQRNIADFWRCWHISLTNWSREYIFMTTLSLLRNPYYATLSSLIFIGIWHELSFRYLAWGLYHGLGIIAYMQWRALKNRLRLPAISNPYLVALARLCSVLLTANYFFLGYVITHEGELAEAGRVMLNILTWGAY